MIWLVPLFPLVGVLLNGFLGPRLGRRFVSIVGPVVVLAAFGAAVMVLMSLLSLPPDQRARDVTLYHWITSSDPNGRSLDAPFAFRIDPLSVTMILVVTGVGFLIHVYSTGYMAEDPLYARYFTFLNLFTFSMLLLVLANNFVLMFVGWEGVGLCSYLLIGFWFDRPSAASAAKKAFITTRIGDTAMMIGLALIVVHFGTLDFTAVLGPAAHGLTKGAATAIALLLLAGAAGKSAQIPLHVWLPDAMEGPTPVSALIHAATMVTAGVYLCVRSHVFFERSGTALTVVLVVGLVTAVYAASAALAQDDIKRVLAYSTISQLGYMFMAVGLRAYAAAMFMFVAHAFYKALLFLGAGSVIHGMEDEQDMKEMGGLRAKMPVTSALMIVAGLSLAGVVPLAGFFAKDTILEIASSSGRPLVWAFGSFAALLSSLYVGRLLFLTFFGEPRSERARHAHEPPAIMTAPLVVLAVGAAAGGVLATGVEGPLPSFLEPVVGRLKEGTAGLITPVTIGIAITLSAVGLLVTWFLYGSGKIDWLALRIRLAPLHRFLQRGWYVDAAYATVLGTPGKAAAAFTAYVFDAKVVDGAVNGVGILTNRLANAARRIQTGFVRNYALGLLVGAVGVLLYMGLRF
jgi:NADH-quinone oxidoreductase subunit L